MFGVRANRVALACNSLLSQYSGVDAHCACVEWR